ncbi:endonuclease [Gordonia rubripertincta]|uniref:Endonuclease n=1 Tax=Gordonia rubripertincta TaxID=36822 RepID=A0ABT4MQX4_GORRU|nr:endonuclease [Gordonia rubripertincta]MCZ4549392.1 endonuclease [Gordonia rubripertincta]
MSTKEQREVAAELDRRAGRTYADEAGIRLQDTPIPLFELLVLTMLLSARISAEIAVGAARELFDAGLRNPKAVIDADRSTIIAALGRGHYARYDESTATRLTEGSHLLIDTYDGDLRKLASACDGDVGKARELLQEFKGIGPVGADIFLREVQDVWSWVAPFYDPKSLGAAQDLNLPADPEKLADLTPSSNAKFAAALLRASLDEELSRAVRVSE